MLWQQRSPDGAISAFTLVCDALWRHPGPGFRAREERALNPGYGKETADVTQYQRTVREGSRRQCARTPARLAQQARRILPAGALRRLDRAWKGGDQEGARGNAARLPEGGGVAHSQAARDQGERIRWSERR